MNNINIQELINLLAEGIAARQIKSVPYQRCPICYGTGRISNEGSSSACYDICDVCLGKKIIPEYIVPEVLREDLKADQKYHNNCDFCGELFWTEEAFNGKCDNCKNKLP